MLLGHTPGSSRFERWAPRFDRSPLQALYFRPLHRRLVRLLSPAGGARILDLGCGTGNLSIRLGAAGASVTGVDVSGSMLAQARRKPRSRTVRFAAAAAEALPFPDHTFDAVVSCVSLHHWTDPPAGLAEARRVLRPGGRMALADMHRLGAARRSLLRRQHPGHHEGWTRAELAGLLRGAGLSPLAPVPHGWLRPFAVLVLARRDAEAATSEP